MTSLFHVGLLLLGTLLLFGLVLWWGLRFRRKASAADKSLRARDLREPGMGDVLYGVWEDFSPTENGMLVRNGEDEVVGKIRYRLGTLSGWIVIEAGTEHFEVDALARFHKTGVLYRAGSRGEPLATCEKRLRSTTFEIAMDGIGAMEGKVRRAFQLAPVTDYYQSGKHLGVGRTIGKYRMRGKLAALPPSLPLPVRLFVLAMQAT